VPPIRRCAGRARLGELLCGDAQPWDAALATYYGIANPDLWGSTGPPKRTAACCCPTYKLAAASEDLQLRVQAAHDMNRYAAEASNPELLGLLQQIS